MNRGFVICNGEERQSCYFLFVLHCIGLTGFVVHQFTCQIITQQGGNGNQYN